MGGRLASTLSLGLCFHVLFLATCRLAKVLWEFVQAAEKVPRAIDFVVVVVVVGEDMSRNDTKQTVCALYKV